MLGAFERRGKAKGAEFSRISSNVSSDRPNEASFPNVRAGSRSGASDENTTDFRGASFTRFSNGHLDFTAVDVAMSKKIL